MGFLRKVFGGTGDYGSSRPWEERPAWMTGTMQVTLLDGHQTLEVVGESHYQDNLHVLVEALAKSGDYETHGDGVRVNVTPLLVLEVNNPHDSNAISVWISGHKVGHLSASAAKAYRPGLVALQKEHGEAIALEGNIVGRPGLYGVFMKHDPEDFGLAPGPKDTIRPEGAGIRTGEGEARASDGEDESYDLSWMDTLPSDTVRRIPKLRKLLEDDPDPIGRHFMFIQLEKDLYSCRDLWPTALNEYDDVAEQHHAEMKVNIRAALFDKFGEVPLIDTYRQGAVREQKARDWEASLRWAERGLEVYGDDAARPEAVEDLKKRVEKARSKLD